MIVFLLSLAGSTLVHELGHFIAARLLGVRVERFSVGFGPLLWSWRGRSGTQYRIGLVLLGGHVLMPHLDDAAYAPKVIVLGAGAASNFLLAIACAGAWIIGRPLPDAVLDALELTSLLNAGLAALNLLPIPVLDGGRMLAAFRQPGKS